VRNKSAENQNVLIDNISNNENNPQVSLILATREYVLVLETCLMEKWGLFLCLK